MAQRKPADDDEPLELTEELELGDAEADEAEGEAPAIEDTEGEEEGEPEGEAEELGAPAFEEDAADEEGENAVIRRMRERISELGKENAELRRAPAPPEIVVGPKPTLADCDYDEDAFTAKLDQWHEDKSKADTQKAEREREAEAANREWEKDLQGYAEKRAELKLPDFDSAADLVKNNLNLAQQAVIVKAATNPAAFIYALGNSDTRLAEVAKIKDPIKLAAAIARMEGGVKVVKKRKAPAPDKPASGSGRLPGGTDKQLEKLEAEAERSGDRTELIRYRKKLKERGKK